tara:strand:- start:183 stop:446 length:264 start_codon:yes stop_codon:yes gene_type:complete
MTDRPNLMKIKLFKNDKGDKPFFRNGAFKVEERIVIEPGTYEASLWKGTTKSGLQVLDLNLKTEWVKPADGGQGQSAPQAPTDDAWG